MKRTLHTALSSALLAFLLGLAPAHAEISHVTVAVDGLGCPFCVFGIEKKLKAVDGVADVTIDLKTGLATVDLVDGATPDVEALRMAVEKAGFTPRAITLTAIGTLALEDSSVFLNIRGSDQRYLLFEKGREDGPPFFDAERFKELSAWAQSATPVAVTGTVHQHADGPPGLSADKLKPLNSLSLGVRGMTCEKCAERLTGLLQNVHGVSYASVDFTTEQATVESVGTPLEPSTLVSVVEDAGFAATVEQEATR